MTVHVIGRVLGESCGSQERGEGVREAVGSVVSRISGPHIGRALLEATRVTCKEQSTVQSAGRCLDCSRFVNYRPTRDQLHVAIRCRWTADDRVDSLMNNTDSRLVVPRDSTLAEARQLAEEYDQRYLLVVDVGVLVGIVDLQAVAGEVGEVTDVMSRRFWVTFPHSTLSDARRIMQDSDSLALPVVDGTRLCGVLAWADLVEVGLA